MKICLVHGDVTGFSGSGRYIADLAERFAEDHHHVTLVCHDCDDAIASKPGIEVCRLPKPSERLWRLGHVAALLNLRRQVRQHLGNRKFDVLLGSDLLFLQPIQRLQGPGLRFIYTPMSMIAPVEIASYELGGFRNFAGIRLYRRLQRWALLRCDRVVRYTEPAVTALENYYHLDLKGKALISVYVSREFDKSSATSSEAPPAFNRSKPAELLWVGRLIKSKNVAFLLRAVARLRSSDWVLVVCSTGPERPHLEELARTLGIERRTRFLGAVPDLPAVYSRASLLLTGSVLEQYSLTLMEAYAFGVPCIGLRPDWKTVFNSNEDQIADGVTGYVVADEQEMADRIDMLLSDEAKRQEMARQAYAMKQRGFSFESFYRDLNAAL